MLVLANVWNHFSHVVIDVVCLSDLLFKWSSARGIFTPSLLFNDPIKTFGDPSESSYCYHTTVIEAFNHLFWCHRVHRTPPLSFPPSSPGRCTTDSSFSFLHKKQQRFGAVMAWCWFVPLMMATLPFSTNNYGDAGAWCSITAKDLKSLEWGTFWRFTIIYVPLWVTIGINAYMCFSVYRAVKGFEAAAMLAYEEAPDEATPTPSPSRAESGREEGAAREGGGGGGGQGGGGQSATSTSMAIVNRLRLYPIALVVCWSWATVNRVFEAIDPYGAVFWLYVLQYSFQVRVFFFIFFFWLFSFKEPRSL